LRILAIDDNTDITKLLDTVLTSVGHEFSCVNNGKDGLKNIREHNYDMVLLDLSMPGFSGLDVVNELVNDGNIGKQKIVLFTASSVSDREIDELIKNGIHSCIRKPVDIDILLDKISQL
jgi:two-component system, OmpR family, response regulator